MRYLLFILFAVAAGAQDFDTPIGLARLSGGNTNAALLVVDTNWLAFGTNLSGVTNDLTVWVTNNGTKTLTGTASTASPFSVVATASYAVATNTATNIVVRYTRSGAATDTNQLALTGGGGTNVHLSGVSTNAPGGQTVNDDFNRAAPLGANWTAVQNTMTIFNSTAAQYGAPEADSCARYSGVTWTANQSSAAEITSGTTSPGVGMGVSVRCSASAATFYRLVIDSGGNWELGWFSAGSFTSLATGTTTYSAGAILKLSAIGTTITSTYNGSQIDSRTDSNIATGSPGICYSYQDSAATADDWEGKDGL